MSNSVATPTRKPKFEIKKAPKYGVVFYNNSTTNMDQVIFLLMEVFNYKTNEAVEKTLEIHEKDASVVYTGSKESCNMKNEQVKVLRSSMHEKDLIHKVELIEE
jgi:ATP-dependent Clp protease adapter protein ClpS